MKQDCELFVLRDGQSPILYAPLRHLAARVNEGAVAAVGRKLNGLALEDGDEAVLKLLEEHGFFTPTELPTHHVMKPVQVTLFPTDGCNLRCRYCYAGAEDHRHVLPLEVGKAAVDLVAANAKELGKQDFVVGFHGNGEPFSAYQVVQEMCRYTHEVGERVGLKPRITTATNGVLNEEQLDWLIAWFDGVNVSFDGIERLQNHQRPFPDGSGSFEYVDRTLRRLNDSGKNFGIRCTLTADSVDCLTEIALTVAERYPRCEVLHIEPAWEAGRSLKTGEHTPDTDIFIEQFLKAEELLKGKMRIAFSAARSESICTSFCGASQNGMTVTSEGLVTSCYEVCEECDPRSERFVYGKYDFDAHEFVFDNDKIEALHRLNIYNIPGCQDCFCKYHCAGDCPAKLLGTQEPETHSGSVRCKIARELTLRQICRMVELPEETEEEDE